MNEFEFLNYFPTPEEKYFMGIATVRFMGKIMLKYKVIEKKDGTGFFVAAPNYRLNINGEYKYVDAIMIDSQMQRDELLDYIRKEVNMAMNPQAPQQQAYVPPPQQVQQPQQQNFAPDLNDCPF